MHQSVFNFLDYLKGNGHLTPELVSGKNIIEVGSHDINGSLRQDFEKMNPKEYLGVDVNEGRGVDQLIDVNESLFDQFGGGWDGIITTEVFEHIERWWETVEDFASMLNDGGFVLLTTRSPGFPFHPFDEDWWRWTAEDIQVVFGCFVNDVSSDMVLMNDPMMSGIFCFFKLNLERFNKRIDLFREILKYRKVYNIVYGEKTSQS